MDSASTSYVRWFIDALPEVQRAAAERAAAELAPRMERVLGEMRQRWPEIELSPERFLAHWAERVPTQGELLAAVDSADAAGLYLAAACTAGDSNALAALEREHGGELQRALAGMGLDRAGRDEVVQRVRAKLFVVGADGAAPKIASFSGRGSLHSWVRAVAVRTAVSLLRKGKREVHMADPVMGAFPDAVDDPELAHFKQLYGDEFRAAFERVFAELSGQEQTVLRYKFADGASIDDIAAVYRVHRATAARWLTRLRERLLNRTREELKARLVVDSEELSSILRLVQSQLDATLSGWFTGPTPTSP